MKSRGNFLNNTSWILGGQILRLIISFFINTISTRYLGTTNFGSINYITSYINFFVAVIGMGINVIIIGELVNNRKDNGKIIGTAIVFKLIAAVVCTCVFLGIIFMTDGNDPVIIRIALLQAAQLPFLCLDIINYWYQSNYQSKYPVIIQTIAYLVTSAYRVFLLITGKSVEWFAFALSLDIIILCVLYPVFYTCHKGPKLKYSNSIAKALIKKSLPFILGNTMLVLYGQMGSIMIKYILKDSSQVGLYASAITICTLISFIPFAIIESGRPLIVEAKEKGEELYRLRFRQLSAALIWICGLYALAVTVFARLIIWILYGNEFLAASTCLRILVWYMLFSNLGSAMHLWLMCEKKNKYVSILCSMGVVSNFVLNLVLINLFGINGAAVSTVLTHMLTNLIFPMMFKETRPYAKQAFKALLLRDINIKELGQIALSKFKRKTN